MDKQSFDAGNHLRQEEGTPTPGAAAPSTSTAQNVRLDDVSLPGRVPSNTSASSTMSEGERSCCGYGSSYGALYTPSDTDSCSDLSKPIRGEQQCESPSCVITMATVVDVQECGGAEVTLRTVPIFVEDDEERDDDEDKQDGPVGAADDEEEEQQDIPAIMSAARDLSAVAPVAVTPGERERRARREGGSTSPSGIDRPPSSSSKLKLSSFLCGVTDLCRGDARASPQTVVNDDVGAASTATMRASDRLTSEDSDTNDLDYQGEQSPSRRSTPVKAAKEELAPPSPEPSTPLASKLSCGPRSCCARTSPCSSTTIGGDAGVAEKQVAVEATIGSFLGSSGTSWCDGWQAWSIHMEDLGNGEGGEGEESGSVMMEPADLKRVLRNRAGDLDARRRRIRRLRRDLSPFDLIAHNGGGSGITGPGGNGGTGGGGRGPIVGGPHLDFPGVKKSYSFSVVSVPQREAPPGSATDVASSVVSMTSSVLDTVQNCGENVDAASSCRRSSRSRRRRGSAAGRDCFVAVESDAAVDDEDEADLCYDSDPGEVGPCRSSRRRNLNRSDGGSDQEEGQILQEDSRLSVESFLQHGGAWASDLDSSGQGEDLDNSLLDPTNDAQMSKAVDDILHRRMTLIWHRASDGKTKDVSPVAIYAWIELGSQLRSALIQPKFMWKPVRETQDEKGSLGITNLMLHSVDLLDISRVLKVNKIDRKRYPLAKRKCSLSIETFDHTVLFEASCEEERDRIVKGIKVLVARLASKIIVGDDRVFDEFFTPFGAGVVPGEPPRWATPSC